MILIMSYQINSIFDGAKAHHFDEGEMVFHANESITQMYLVRSGCAVLVRPLPSGNSAYLQRAFTNDVVAEASLYAETYHCDCMALQPAVLAVMPRKEFQSRLRSDVYLYEAWATHLARTIQRTRMGAEIRSLRTISERLDAWLAEYGPLPEKGLWQGVANELSVSREAFYRELARRRKK